MVSMFLEHSVSSKFWLILRYDDGCLRADFKTSVWRGRWNGFRLQKLDQSSLASDGFSWAFVTSHARGDRSQVVRNTTLRVRWQNGYKEASGGPKREDTA